MSCECMSYITQCGLIQFTCYYNNTEYLLLNFAGGEGKLAFIKCLYLEKCIKIVICNAPT